MDFSKINWKKVWKKTWYFIWESDSIMSWIVNILLAFILIKFIIYPGLGFVMQTSYPIVAVVSGSMEHKAANPCLEFDIRTNECAKFDEDSYWICGETFDSKQKSGFEFFWSACGGWYTNNTDITKEDFLDFGLKDGFNKGDIMVLRGSKPENLEVGDTIVFMSQSAPYPIIHRIIQIEEEDSYTFTTKGDHNSREDIPINENSIIGKAILRIPFLGWVKIGFVKLINVFTGVL